MTELVHVPGVALVTLSSLVEFIGLPRERQLTYQQEGQSNNRWVHFVYEIDPTLGRVFKPKQGG